jgi:hypothetical protein
MPGLKCLGKEFGKNNKKIMSTYFFKTNPAGNTDGRDMKTDLDKLRDSQQINKWNVDFRNAEQVLEIETSKMSPEQVKHFLREAGYDVEFTIAPGR